MIKNINKLIIVGDRILIKPDTDSGKTNSGLFLPPGIAEKDKVQTGYVIKTGPGYALPHNDEEEPWKESKGGVKYLPLQVKPGDLAIFLRKEAIEIEFEKEKFLVVNQSSILLVFRDDLLDFE